MATYKKKLKRAKDGCIVRYIGKNFAGQSEKFRLGFDLREAEKREALILELWVHLERNWNYMDRAFYWSKPYLSAAKAIAKGKPPVFPATFKHQSNPASYVETMKELGASFNPANAELFEEGVRQISEKIRQHRDSLSSRGATERTGQTISDGISGFRDHLQNSALSPDDFLSTWGKTQLTQLQSWENFLAEAVRVKEGVRERRDYLGMDLAEVSLPICQEMIDVIRQRPITFESRRKHEKNPEAPLSRLKSKSATNIIRIVIQFFEWLDLSDEFNWEEPPKFGKLNTKPVPITADERFARQQKMETFTVPKDHVAILSKYALPLERVMLLLGLNCAFGPGEIGQLRLPFIKKDSREIIGIRFKTGGETRHQLWSETLEGLNWQLAQRGSLKRIDDNDQEVVFLTDTGKPLWRKTKAGNYSDGISRAWARLVKRIRQDHTDFPEYSFGKLRKTAATEILKLADAESASLILAHRTISEDELLKHYVQLPWEKLYEAQAKFGESIAPYLALDRPAFAPRPVTYIGLKKVERILELDRQGKKKAEIAKEVGVSIMTVYRHLQNA